MRRSRRYGSMIAISVASATSVPPMMTSVRIGTPAASMSAPTAKQITSAVPMSGCFRSSTHEMPTTTSSGRSGARFASTSAA